MSTPKSFIPVSVHRNKGIPILDIDEIEVDFGESTLVFPSGTSVKVAREFIEFYLIPEFGSLPHEVHQCEDDKSCVYATFDPELGPEVEDEIDEFLVDLCNSLRS